MTVRTDWVLDRGEATSRRGMVAAKHPLAAEAGAEMLHAGGNAIDAAVAAAFVAGVVEPFMSGIGGGGFLVAYLPANGERVVIDFAMVASRHATADMYTLSGGTDAGMFGWPAVVDDANIAGHRAAAVPGAVAGLCLALERYGSLPLAHVLAPAIEFAENGFPVSWHTALMIGIDLELLNRFPASRAIFTDGGFVPNPYPGLRQPLRQRDLAQTLRAIAASGPRAFYEGDIARAIAREMFEHGGLIDEGDLAAYQATIGQPLQSTYRGYSVLATPVASGGPTVLETLHLMEGAALGAMPRNSAGALHQIAESARQAFADRFASLADPRFVAVPIDRLLSKAYAAERRQRFLPSHASPPDLAGASPEKTDWGAPRMTTTHVSAIDDAGNAVSLTSTLLGGWGCGVTVPGTGVLLNNGMMWFDPVPGRANSIAGGKKPLANMAPLLLLDRDRALMSLGAMGGRRILNALPQIVSNILDHGMGMQAAITAPRIDCSTGIVQVSSRIAPETVRELRAIGHQVEVIEEDVLGFEFGSPVGILVEEDTLRGGANPYYPAMAIGLE